MNEEKKVVVYHYNRKGVKYTTPNLKIAVGRKDDENIKIETIIDGVSDISNLEILTEEPKVIKLDK